MSYSATPVKSGSVHLEYREERSTLDDHVNCLKQGLLGPYRLLMGIVTLANQYLNPELPLSELSPSIQGSFESVAYRCGINTTPHIKEVHLARSPIGYGKVRIPCTKIDAKIPLPQSPVSTFYIKFDPDTRQDIITDRCSEGTPLSDDIRLVTHTLLGPYRTCMGIATLANKYFYPDQPILPPSIQGRFELAAYHCGLNPTFPYITELHLPRSPIRFEKVKLPFSNREITIILLQFPVNTFHVQSDPVLNQEILKPHRKVTFSGGSDSYLSAFKLLQTIFPETTFTENDFLLTSGPEFTKKAHKAISSALSGEKIDLVIQNEGQKLIELWSQYSSYGKRFDLTKEMRSLAAAVITQVVFDNREGHEDLEDAVSFMNDHLLKSALGMASKGDKEKFAKACSTFRTITNKILESEQVLPLFEGDFTLAEKQGLCLLVFFAGMETTAFALSHIFATLSLDQELQTNLRKAVVEMNYKEIKGFVDTTLSKIPPAKGLSRSLTHDAVYSFETENGPLQKYVRKGEKILTVLTAKSIFGSGVNQCIGKMLAMKEFREAIRIILSNFELSTNEKEFGHVSKVAEQALPFFIRVKKTYT